MSDTERDAGSRSASERRGPHPYRRPRDAATLLIVDRSGSRPKVLMGRRHAGHVFMPGKFVFPGGRLEPADSLMESCSELTHATEVRLAARTPLRSRERGRALALAAIRETYEETGLLAGRPGEGRPRAGPAWAAFFARGILPDLARLAFVGRAVTPTGRPRRFDTRFFALDRAGIAAEATGFIGPDKELVELVWVEIEAARELDLPRITGIMLGELAERVAAGLPDDHPAPFYREERGRFVRDLI